MAKNKDRRISQNHPSKSKRIRKPEEQVNYNNRKPVFSFEYIDKAYCVSKCERDEKASFADKLRILGSLTWNEIIQSPRHQHGFEKIPIQQINGSKPIIISPDVDYVIAFRFHNTKPVVGLRRDQVFFIIWLDRDYSLYDHS